MICNAIIDQSLSEHFQNAATFLLEGIFGRIDVTPGILSARRRRVLDLEKQDRVYSGRHAGVRNLGSDAYLHPASRYENGAETDIADGLEHSPCARKRPGRWQTTVQER